MLTALYRLGTAAYFTAIRLGAAVGIEPARKWTAGRRNPAASDLPAELTDRPPGRRLLWIHAASLGEWEQGRPVVEALRQHHPGWRVLLTFFSPSGYERRRNDELVDFVRYLPADTPARARTWVAALRPELVVFVKYEFWFYFLRELHRAGVPTYLIAASFRPGQAFFRSGPLGAWWRRVLGYFSGIVVQTAADAELLVDRADFPAAKVTVGGDPRGDRTLQLAARPFQDETLAAFTTGDRLTLIAGSVWGEDVEVLAEVWPSVRSHYRLLLAPHQLKETELTAWQGRFGAERYTQTTPGAAAAAEVLILDVIGLLSRAYRYGDVAYVGGAFRTGLHNTLEPMAYGLPTLFGPHHHKFPEAAAAIRAGGAVSIATAEETRRVLTQWTGAGARVQSQTAQRRTAEANRGAGVRTLAAIMRGEGDG